MGTIGWSVYLDRTFSLRQLSWIIYLLFLSFWEEWAFRVGLPKLLQDLGLETMHAMVISNMLFGAMHYVTLRWKALWCFFAFLFGMHLSNQWVDYGDIWLIVGFTGA